MKSFAYALVVVASAGFVAAAGCVSSSAGSDESAEAITLTPFAGDGGDAGSGPARQSVVISQVYGGGGKDGASFNHDFVEIFNRTQKAVVLDGMSLQLSDTATSSFTTAIPLAGKLQPGAYELIQLGTDDDTVGTALPAADLSNDAQIGSATDGKVAISFTASALNCGGTSNLCATTKLMDMIGFGQVSQLEGLVSAPALDVTHADERNANGCTDTDNNSSDFTSVTPPAPRNSQTATNVCPASSSKDGGSSSSSGGDGSTVPPVKDPPLGPESPFDGGVNSEAGAAAQGAGGSDGGCAVSAGRVAASSTELFALFAGVGLVAAAITRRRKR